MAKKLLAISVLTPILLWGLYIGLQAAGIISDPANGPSVESQTRQSQPTGSQASQSPTKGQDKGSPDQRSSERNSQVELAWGNIADQMKTYQVLNSLTGKERIQAANKLVFGYEQLRKDVDFFLTNARSDDPRREAVTELKRTMEKSRNKQ